MLAELEEDLVHLEGGRDRLDQDRGPDRAGVEAEPLLGMAEHLGPLEERALGDQDYSREDQLDTAKFNAALWAGRATRGEAPASADESDLRRGRAALLSAWRISGRCAQ